MEIVDFKPYLSEKGSTFFDLTKQAWGVGGLGMGLAYSTISLVVLETASPGQEGSATASMELASVLGSAPGAGLGGVIIGVTSAAGSLAGTGIAMVDIFVIAVTGLAILTAVRLQCLPQPTASLTWRGGLNKRL